MNTRLDPCILRELMRRADGDRRTLVAWRAYVQGCANEEVEKMIRRAEENKI